jgi:hypothetical protein
MKFGWINITGNGAFISHTLEICEEPNRKAKKKWIDIKNYGDSYPISLEKCPTGWFFVNDFYGYSGWVRQTHRMQILKES